MKTRAAVAWEAGKPLTIETIEIGGPKAGEVLVEVMATGRLLTRAIARRRRAPERTRPEAESGSPARGVLCQIGRVTRAVTTAIAPSSRPKAG